MGYKLQRNRGLQLHPQANKLLLPWRSLLLPAFGTCVGAAVVLQVSSRGELLATVLLLAGERLLAVVGAHVHLQPLQHVEALPAAFGAAPEHPVVPWRGREKQRDFSRDGVSESSVTKGAGAPVCFKVVLQVSRPGERPAAALERAAQDLPGEGAAGLRSPVSVRGRVVCVVA